MVPLGDCHASVEVTQTIYKECVSGTAFGPQAVCTKFSIRGFAFAPPSSWNTFSLGFCIDGSKCQMNSVNRLKVYLETQPKKSPKNEKIFWNEFDFRYFPQVFKQLSLRVGGRVIRTLLTCFALILLGWLFTFLITWGVGMKVDTIILACSCLNVALLVGPSQGRFL